MRAGSRGGGPPWVGTAWRRTKGFLLELQEKAGGDNLFFLASGLTFSLLLAAIPFLLLLLATAGFLLAPEFAEPRSEVLARLWELFPVTDPSVRSEVEVWIGDLAERSRSVGLVSGVLFIWFSTRLFGALRTVLGEVFDLRDDRGVLKGKLADVGMVLLSTVLLSVNITLTSLFTNVGGRTLHLVGVRFGGTDAVVGMIAAFLFLFVMFLMIFKFVPARRLPLRTAVLAALLATLGFESMKAGFGWYLASFADYSTVFFASATAIVALIGLYYGSLTFILSGEIAQLAEERRVMRRQREVFE